MNYIQFLELVKSRRSIRRFRLDPIPTDYIEKILEAARWAPSGANTQPWEFIVVKDKKLKNKIVDIITKNAPPRVAKDNDPKPLEGFKDAPIFIIVCGDTRRKILLPGTSFKMINSKIKKIKNQFLDMENIFNTNLANTFLYIHLAAKSLGLGSQWITATAAPKIQLEIKKILKIPKHMVIYDTVALGFPATIPGPRFVRTLKEITHHDLFDITKSKTDAELVNSSNDFMKHARAHLNRNNV